ncbi:hypothetical protein Dsin_001450 [Dipteronia sinensis]|uniref:Uncharacterized protein n=1 Tax=Dipteronia sinensis TaxID=43782 RepID=A0AAE0EIR9_9ROSI|nr:hypothetical protein Dsin_001450 [Dipteronia sinensis]
MNTTATGDHVWAPSSNVLPSDGCEPIDNDIIVLDNYLVDEDLVKVTFDAGGLEKKKNKRIIEEHETKVIKKKKGIKGGKIGGAVKVSQQIDSLIDFVKTIREDTIPSISEVMNMVESLPGVEVGSDLWLFSTHLFLTKKKTDVFSIMKEPETA